MNNGFRYGERRYGYGGGFESGLVVGAALSGNPGATAMATDPFGPRHAARAMALDQAFGATPQQAAQNQIEFNRDANAIILCCQLTILAVQCCAWCVPATGRAFAGLRDAMFGDPAPAPVVTATPVAAPSFPVVGTQNVLGQPVPAFYPVVTAPPVAGPFSVAAAVGTQNMHIQPAPALNPGNPYGYYNA